MMGGLSFLPTRPGTGAGHEAGARTSFWGLLASPSSDSEVRGP